MLFQTFLVMILITVPYLWTIIMMITIMINTILHYLQNLISS
ncbi:unnamed protein product [Schistosoma margrebowiei]|uniref:Uncharacterized protein n=1 Tax=Schistosoma margrebowiei TaxID=48269 RepID=A0A183MDV2_9TREM|nr:unnamed protein product [Schistosoma margrebowiei]